MAESLRLPLGGASLEWEIDALMRAADAADPEAAPAWELNGTVDWSAIGSIRLICAAAGETALALAVARPADARAHDEDQIAAALVSETGAEAAAEALLSTEYDPDGAVRRLGVELWPAEGIGRRIAADRAGQMAMSMEGGLRREATPLAVRLEGASGSGLHELLRPA